MNRRWLLFIPLGVVILAVGCYFFNPFGNHTAYLTLPGVVEVQEVRLGSKIGGRVESVNVREGEEVSPNQALVTLEVPELKSQQAQWKAKLEAARADLEKAKNGPRKEEKKSALAASEAAKAKYELMKAGFREEEKRQTAADVEAAEAEAKQAREDFDRVSDLYRQKSASRADYELSFALRGRAVAKVSALKARNEMMQTGNRPEEIDQSLQEWKRLKANYELLEAGTRPEEIALAQANVKELEAKLEEVAINLREAVIYAKDKAVVEVVAVRPGDLVTPNQPVVRVLRVDDMWVKVWVPETELGKLRLNQNADVSVSAALSKRLQDKAVEVSVDAYPSKKFVGKVIQVATISEYTPRNVQSIDERRHQVFAVKVRIDDPQGVFRSGMAAEVRLPLAEAP